MSSVLSLASTQKDSQESLITAESPTLSTESDELPLMPAGDARKNGGLTKQDFPRRRRRRGKSRKLSVGQAAPLMNSTVAPVFDSQNGFNLYDSPTTTPGINRSRPHSSKESSSQNNFISFEHETINLSPDEMNHMKPFSKGDDLLCFTKSFIGQKNFCYPLVYISPAGVISIVLSPEIIVETSVDHSIRVVRHGNFSTYVNDQGTNSSIVHLNARILHTQDNGTVVGRFVSAHDKVCILGNNGVLFTMDHLHEAFLVNSGSKGASSVVADCFQFPRLASDYTIHQFYANTQTGQDYIPLCQEIVDSATYDRRADGSLLMQVNCMTIRYMNNGDVVIDARPRHISCSADGSVHLRTPYIDIGVQASGSAFIKFGQKRVHVSVSGMVVSDGSSCTSMDQCGRILLST